MKLFDVLIWAVILLSLIYALYRGFVHSVLSQAALLLSLLIDLPLSAGPASQLQGNTSFTSLLSPIRTPWPAWATGTWPTPR